MKILIKRNEGQEIHSILVNKFKFEKILLKYRRKDEIYFYYFVIVCHIESYLWFVS